MLRAGLPVLNTLEMLEGQTSGLPMKKVIQTIKKDLESGNAFIKNVLKNMEKYLIL